MPSLFNRSRKGPPPASEKEIGIYPDAQLVHQKQERALVGTSGAGKSFTTFLWIKQKKK